LPKNPSLITSAFPQFFNFKIRQYNRKIDEL
jgi:hypothetical protein